VSNRLGRAFLVPVYLLVALLTACTATAEPDRDTLPDARTIATDVSVVEVGSPGRLLVLGTESEIITMRPDGSDPVTLAEAVPDVERTQPTWSPDGSRVAWTERRGDQQTYLLVADSHGGEVVEWPSPLLAVYIAWSPDGEHLALTGSLGEGDLLLAIAEPDGDIQVLDQGAPVYFDWAPDGTEVLARVSGRFEYLAIDGSGRETVPVTGEFRLGAHVAESLLLGTGREVGEALALANRQGEIERELLRYTAPMAFVADEPGSRVAVMSRGSPESQELSRLEETDLPIIDAERLFVVTTSDGHLEEISRARNISWFWSPNGRDLLYSTVGAVDGTERLQWHTWDGEETKSYAPFSPTGLFARDYLAYFDQFALSISLWAPDGSAFVYAGGNSLEDAGIWVQKVEGGDPVRVSPGEVALWSPAA
jgi:Tol biopolymer transport system component